MIHYTKSEEVTDHHDVLNGNEYVEQLRSTVMYVHGQGLPLTFPPLNAKGHAQTEWQNHAVTDLATALDRCSPVTNVAVVWQSDASNNAFDLEFEHPGFEIFLEHSGLPRSTMAWGSPKNPGSHHAFRADAPVPYLKVSAADGTLLMERRTGNRFSIIPHSQYPGGGSYTWSARGDIPELDANTAIEQTNLIGALVLLAHVSPARGQRDDFYGALAGGLAEGGYTEDTIARIVETIATATGDEEVDKRKGFAYQTVRKYENGEAITSWSALGKIIEKKDVAQIRLLFGLAPVRGAKVANDLHDVSNADGFYATYGHLFAHVEELGDLAFDGKKWCKGDAATAQIMKWGVEYVKSLAVAAEKEPNRRRRQDLTAWARTSHALSKIRSMTQLAMVYATSTVDAWDADTFLFNCETGTIDLRTQTVQPHDQKHKITKYSPVPYDPEATCPVWEAFMLDISNGDADVVKYRKKMYGYALTGDTREDVHHFLTGQGSNGKSLEVETIAKVFGDYAIHVRPESLAVRKGGATNDLARMAGARLVITTESDDGMRLDESMIKTLTGDTITARYLYRENFEFKPTAKLVMATNHRPVIHGTSHGIWRRVREIQYEVVFAEVWETPLIKNAAVIKNKDKTLDDRLEKELPGILAWAVRGCALWLDAGLQPIEKILTWTAEYRDDQDVMMQFMAEKTRRDPKAKTATGDVYWGYRSWCQHQGEEPMTAQKFGRRLTDLGYPLDRSTSPKMRGGLALQDAATVTLRV